MVRDFIKRNASLWKGKKVFCVNTMGLFSGDGTGCTARILKKYGAEILGSSQPPKFVVAKQADIWRGLY